MNLTFNEALEKAQEGLNIKHVSFPAEEKLIWSTIFRCLLNMNGNKYSLPVTEHMLEGWQVEQVFHDWSWALEQLSNGKKVTRDGWVGGYYVKKDHHGYLWNGRDNKAHECNVGD